MSLLGSGANFFPSSSHMTVRYADGHTVNATTTENDSGVVFRFGIPQMTSFSASYTGVADGDVRVIPMVLHMVIIQYQYPHSC